MANIFNSDFLVDKLARFTDSKQKIESLCQWCLSHMNKAKEIVELWSRQFHSSPREQRVAFLFLANDILQNSWRKGAEFVLEFWKVLPNSLHDVIKHGKVSERDAALRLINIWVKRSVFGSRSKILKEGLLNRQSDNIDRNLRSAGFQMRSPCATALDKIVSGFQLVYGNQLDEDVIFRKCRYSISFVEKVDEATKVGLVHGGVRKELVGQHATLRDCMEQLKVVKSSREYLVTLLQEALQEQENKLNQVGDLLQLQPLEWNRVTRLEQSSSVIFTPVEKSSAQLPTCLHSPFASQGVIGTSNNDLSRKIARIDNDHIFYVPPPPPPLTGATIMPSGPYGYRINPSLPPLYPSFIPVL